MKLEANKASSLHLSLCLLLLVGQQGHTFNLRNGLRQLINTKADIFKDIVDISEEIINGLLDPIVGNGRSNNFAETLRASEQQYITAVNKFLDRSLQLVKANGRGTSLQHKDSIVKGIADITESYISAIYPGSNQEIRKDVRLLITDTDQILDDVNELVNSALTATQDVAEAVLQTKVDLLQTVVDVTEGIVEAIFGPTRVDSLGTGPNTFISVGTGTLGTGPIIAGTVGTGALGVGPLVSGSVGTGAISTIIDPCIQDVWFTLPNGELTVIRKNVCGPELPPPKPTTPRPTVPLVDPCIQEVWETLPNGELVVIRKNICGPEPPAPTTTTTSRPTTTTTRRPITTTRTTTTTTTTPDPCIQEVWETLPNGEIVVVRKNVCGPEPPAPTTTTTQTPIITTTTRTTTTTTTSDPCIQEVWETLPNGEVVVVRKNVCGGDGSTPQPTTAGTTAPSTTSNPCIADVAQTLPNGQFAIVRKNIC